jgi:hypothetical protein
VDRRRPGRRFTTGSVLLFAAGTLAFSVGSISPAAGLASKLSRGGPQAPAGLGHHLRAGGIIRLAYVNEESTGQEWRADGSPASASDSSPFGGFNGTFKANRPDGRRLIAFNLIGTGMSDEVMRRFSPIYRIHGHHEAQYDGGVGIQSEDSSLNRDYWLVPATLAKVDMDCDIATDDFRTVEQGPIGQVSFNATIDYNQGQPKDGRPKVTHVTLVRPRNLFGKQLNLQAFDSDGNNIRASGGSLDDGKNQVLNYSFVASGVKIATLALESRDFEHFTLTDIHLRPSARP